LHQSSSIQNRRPFYLGAVAFVSFPNCQQSGAEGLPPPSRTFLLFIFATLDGTISARNPAVDGVIPGPSPGTTLSHATIVADQVVAGATYTGLAIATNTEGQTFLYAADGGPNRAVDMLQWHVCVREIVQRSEDPEGFHDLRHSSDQRRDLGDVYCPEQGAGRVCGRFCDPTAPCFATTRSMDRCTRPGASLWPRPTSAQ
jgi:hypothetical protein